MKCSRLGCPKKEPKDVLYPVHYKIAGGAMVGQAKFCVEHLPEPGIIGMTDTIEYAQCSR